MSGKSKKKIGKRPSKYPVSYSADEDTEEREEEKYKLNENTVRITKPSLRRLAKRGGVQRINAEVYDTAREFMQRFMEASVKVAMVYTEQAGRKTITTADIRDSLKRMGRPLYSEY